MTRFADELFRADSSRTAMRPLTETAPDITPEHAYSVQILYLEKKVARGAVVIGKKIGLTSKAIREALHVNEPDFGCLLDTMAVLDGGTVSLSTLIQPKVEGEIAFVLDRGIVFVDLAVAQVAGLGALIAHWIGWDGTLGVQVMVTELDVNAPLLA